MSCRLPEPLFRALKHLAVDQRLSLNDVVVAGLTAYWEAHPDRPKYAHLVESPHQGGRRR